MRIRAAISRGCCVARGQAPLVEPQYRACLALTPDDARLRYGLAELLRERGDGRRRGGRAGTAVCARSRQAAEAHDQMGLALAEAGRFAEAAERFRKAVALDPAQAVFRAISP